MVSSTQNLRFWSRDLGGNHHIRPQATIFYGSRCVSNNTVLSVGRHSSSLSWGDKGTDQCRQCYRMHFSCCRSSSGPACWSSWRRSGMSASRATWSGCRPAAGASWPGGSWPSARWVTERPGSNVRIPLRQTLLFLKKILFWCRYESSTHRNESEPAAIYTQKKTRVTENILNKVSFAFCIAS